LGDINVNVVNTAKYAAALKRLADTGFAGAGAPPIED
jgi:hypothetical protein